MTNGQTVDALEVYSEKTELPLKYLKSIGMLSENGVLSIPYYDCNGDLISMRYRKGDKRWWRKGDRTALYGLWKHGSGSGDILYITEGESDWQTLDYHGYVALGCPGATNFSAQWVIHMKNYKEICIVPDNDKGGEDFVKKTVEQLRKAGYRGKVSVLALPKDVKDVNDLHRRKHEL